MAKGDAPAGAGPAASGSSAASAAPAELGVLISAGAGEPDRLLLVERPSNGRVHVREWSTHNWSSAPDERDLAVADALAIFQRAYDSRRRMSVSLKGIEAWLAGRPA
ncbi:MAG TPA: hypothetical protein VFT57_08500 [Gemmatimonadaceae bacterium]|jgi:hypothetical protein|nr:hypothetical protein [Gemmatimonadaceae bacterium]